MSLKYEGADLKDLSDALKSEFARGSNKMRTFALTAPISASVKLADGQYRKVAFTGNEEFRLVSSYVGKKNGVIICFARKSPVNYASMELPLDVAVKNMDTHFGDLVHDVITKLVGQVDEVNENVLKNKEVFENESRARLMADPRYGAW